MEKKNNRTSKDLPILSIDEIKRLRYTLPDNWKWNKCYELAYISNRTGREFILKHWALQAPDGKGCVCSLGLISHDNFTESRAKFMKDDAGVEWVEKSLSIVDTLLNEIESLRTRLSTLEAEKRKK